MAATIDPEAAARDGVALRCLAASEGGGAERRAEPVRCGVPWPRATLRRAGDLRLFDPRGKPHPAQVRALDRWPDGSVRWALVDWLASTSGGDVAYTAIADPNQPAPTGNSLRATAAAGGEIAIDTGRAVFSLRPGGAFPFAHVRLRGRSVLDREASGLCVTDGRAQSFRPRIDSLVIEEEGPIRVVVRAEGQLARPGSKPLLRLVARLHFFADSATVEMRLTLHNPRRAGHPSGRWGLGSAGSVYIEDAALTLALQSSSQGGEIHCSPELGMPLVRCDGPLELYQDSSGGDHWQSSNHLTRDLEIGSRFRGYALRCATAERRGQRATPIATLANDADHLGLAVRHFWQNFPQAVEAGAGALALRLFPGRFAALHELQGGEQKTHVFHLAFERDGVTDLPLDWCRAPLRVRADPRWYAASEAVPFLLPRADDPNDGYLALIDAAVEGDDTFAHKRERIDEYGWRNFGDLYADHETLFHEGDAPLISHYNNQYDAIAGCTIQFLRSGDSRWQDLAGELAQHVVDIDLYRTTLDKSAYNGGMFWHTDHYTDAHTATHRGSPRLPGVAGGGPAPGHLYTSGLVLHYFLTGDPAAREAVLGLGQYVIDCDDGRRSRFRLLSHAPTGYASESGFDGYHGPGRSPGNAVNTLVDAHRLSAERRFLDKAEVLIERCIHPADDLEARNLLDAEHRWFYTVFLVSLGKYLDRKAELGETDRLWGYARASLLHYSRWALRHEYPYLEKPEILEFPTETWAAQDMRKSEVFRLAARHTEGAERERFLARARFFFDDSIRQLSQMETRRFCRPVVLLLTLGCSQAWFDCNPLPPPPKPASEGAEFDRPRPFIPQKALVKKRLLWLAAGALLSALSLIVFGLQAGP